LFMHTPSVDTVPAWRSLVAFRLVHVLEPYTASQTVLRYLSMYALSGVASGMCLEVSTVWLVQG